MLAPAPRDRRFQLVLIKPSHYDSDGYVIQWARSSIPSNSLASVYALAQDSAARDVLVETADRLGCPTIVYGQDFLAHGENGRMIYQDEDGLMDLTPPRLPGRHQFANAAAAIAAVKAAGFDVSQAATDRAMTGVAWPGRMQRLSHGALVDLAPKGAEIWLDGGHNPHGALAVARAIADLEERGERPLYLICGMLSNKDARGYFGAWRGLVRRVATVAIPGEAGSLGAGALYDAAREVGLEAAPTEDLEDAMLQIVARTQMDAGEAPPRILICGSLYLAGRVLAENG